MEAIDKTERGRRWKAAFDEAVDAHVAKYGGSRPQAVEAVTFSRTLTEQHRLEKLEKGLITDEHVAKAGLSAQLQRSPTVGGQLQRPVTAQTHFNDYGRVDTSGPPYNTGGASNEVISAADLLQQRAAALKDKNPGLSMSAAIDQAMTDSKVREASGARHAPEGRFENLRIELGGVCRSNCSLRTPLKTRRYPAQGFEPWL